MSLSIVILAAGQGTRMRSAKAKVLHTLAGKPLLQHVIDTAQTLNPEQIVTVIGHQAGQVRQVMDANPVTWAEQTEQLGTGHAVRVAMPKVTGDTVLVLYGDVPLIRSETLQRVLQDVEPGRLNLLTVLLDNPYGYGRIIRNAAGEVERIIEEKDADDAQRAIREGNTGILAIRREELDGLLAQLDQDNAQGEFYLTDCIELCRQSGGHVVAIQTGDLEEVSGVNNKLQLAQLERAYQHRAAATLMADGVTLADPARFDLRGSLKAGKDVEIDINCVFEGDVSLGNNVHIGPNCQIINSTLCDDVKVLANTVIENSTVGEGAVLGPFARLRPATELAANTKVGNFVEIKKAKVGVGSKVNHLSYIGDAEIGEGVNIGAGTITCNYDGVNKFKTIIGDGAFIGSNTSLVAPVTIGRQATIGASSAISKDAVDGKLTLTRAPQVTIDSWQRPEKEKK